MAFRFTCRLLASLRRCLWVIWLAICLFYASLGLWAEFLYRDGAADFAARDGAAGLAAFHHAADIFPLERRYRLEAALTLGNAALSFGTAEWQAAALPELKMALVRDPTQSDLLAILLLCELHLHRDHEAKAVYWQFRHVARASLVADQIWHSERGTGLDEPPH